jgi:hypothetical protein
MNSVTCRVLVLFAALSICSCAPKESPLKDGEYFGYEFFGNLSPEEDPHAQWYYAGILTIHGGVVSLKQFPRYISHDKVISSASDGGFPEYEGNIEVVGNRVIVSLRKVACDYCGIPVDDPLPSKIAREYVVRIIKDGTFELNRVVYSSQRNRNLEHESQH